MNIIGSHHCEADKPIIINNRSSGAVQYRVEFPGAGSVRFMVQPGARFEIEGRGVVNIYPEDVLPGGVSLVTD